MDNITFGEFMESLTKHMKKADEDGRKLSDVISMSSLLKPDPEKSAPPSEGDDLLDELQKSDSPKYPNLGKVGRPEKGSAPPEEPSSSPEQGRKKRYPFSPKHKQF